MALKLASYLFVNRFNCFYFRRAVPPDLRQHFDCRTLYKSLRTSERRYALTLAARYIWVTDHVFDRLRTMTKKKDDELIRWDMMVQFDMNDMTLRIDAEPHEVEAATAMGRELLKTALEAKPRQLSGRAQAKPASAAKALSWVWEKYQSENARTGAWSDSSAKDLRGDFQQFLAIVGDVPIGELTKADLVAAKDKLLCLPANLNKRAALKGKSINEILALELPAQSPSTVNKKLERIRAFLTWAQANDYVVENVAQGIGVKAKSRSFDKFTLGDLKKLFESMEYAQHTFDQPYKYWVPLIALFTGARLEEICQLYLADMKLHEDGWFFHITQELEANDQSDGHKKKLKTDSSERVCPVHPKLVELGLLAYIDKQRGAGHVRFFPELRVDEGGRLGPQAGKWFTRYRRAQGVGSVKERSTKVFHSFRHTMNAQLQTLGVAQEIREMLCGHRPTAINVAVYGAKKLDHLLVEANAKLHYAIEFTPYNLTIQKGA